MEVKILSNSLSPQELFELEHLNEHLNYQDRLHSGALEMGSVGYDRGHE